MSTAELRDGQDRGSGRSPAPAVTRAAAILDVLAEPGVGALGLAELARRLRIPKSSVANLCVAMEESGLLRRVNDGYLLGQRLLELGSAYLRSIDEVQDFHDTCRSLRTISHETVLFATLDGVETLYLARHDGSQPIRLASDIGRRLPAGCTALGKAMLAQLDPAVVAERYGQLTTFPVLTPHSNQSLDEMLDDLALTREHGYAVDDEENTLGVVCFAVALPSNDRQRPRRAVSVTMLKARVTAELQEQVVSDLRQVAGHLSARVAVERGEPAAL
ncbi:MAG: IclR family transcriptional regulator [Solirubrobacteraceae bacterium]